ncbi:hypothetical protein [Xanthomonas sp. NCPPB 2632]|uniref:hypothetical protein n=1 Tax=Xanthomonas sp. NCPPB 2632 TaxID=3240912 RepID=UPI00351189E1
MVWYKREWKKMLKHVAMFCLCAAGGASLSAAHAADAHRSVDARTLDVAGVKTGMDFNEARAALIAHFHAASSDIKQDPYPGENPVTHTKLPSYLSYEKDGAKVTVHFEGRVPVDKARPLVVSQIDYELPWSTQNSQAMANAALEKYGVQSNAPNKLPMQWCVNPSRNAGMGCSVTPQAVLTLSQVHMTLTDPAWSDARIQFIEASHASKPSF